LKQKEPIKKNSHVFWDDEFGLVLELHPQNTNAVPTNKVEDAVEEGAHADPLCNDPPAAAPISGTLAEAASF